METSKDNMLITSDLIVIISLRLSKSNWNRLHNRTEFGKTVNVINSLRSVIIRKSGELKVATEKGM